MQELFVSLFDEFVVTESKNDSIKALESQINGLKTCDEKLMNLLHGGFGCTVQHERLNREITALGRQITTQSENNIYKAFKKKITKYDGEMVGRFFKEAIVQDWTVAFIF